MLSKSNYVTRVLILCRLHECICRHCTELDEQSIMTWIISGGGRGVGLGVIFVQLHFGDPCFRPCNLLDSIIPHSNQVWKALCLLLSHDIVIHWYMLCKLAFRLQTQLHCGEISVICLVFPLTVLSTISRQISAWSRCQFTYICYNFLYISLVYLCITTDTGFFWSTTVWASISPQIPVFRKLAALWTLCQQWVNLRICWKDSAINQVRNGYSIT